MLRQSREDEAVEVAVVGRDALGVATVPVEAVVEVAVEVVVPVEAVVEVAVEVVAVVRVDAVVEVAVEVVLVVVVAIASGEVGVASSRLVAVVSLRLVADAAEVVVPEEACELVVTTGVVVLTTHLGRPVVVLVVGPPVTMDAVMFVTQLRPPAAVLTTGASITHSCRSGAPHLSIVTTSPLAPAPSMHKPGYLSRRMVESLASYAKI